MATRSLDDVGTPAVVVVKALVAKGWQFGQAVPLHTLETPPIASDKDMVERKPYLQCLLFLADMLDKGLGALSSKEAPAYYSCVLNSPAPGDIAVGQTRRYYEAILNGQQPHAATQVDNVAGEWAGHARFRRC